MDTMLYQAIAGMVQARANCIKSGNDEWRDKHEDRVEYLCKNHMPSGSGFDSTKIDWDKSSTDRLVFLTAFHHMNEGGFYDGWTEHTVTVTPSLQMGFYLRITGANRNDIKEHIDETFRYSLCEMRDQWYADKTS